MVNANNKQPNADKNNATSKANDAAKARDPRLSGEAGTSKVDETKTGAADPDADKSNIGNSGAADGPVGEVQKGAQDDGAISRMGGNMNPNVDPKGPIAGHGADMNQSGEDPATRAAQGDPVADKDTVTLVEPAKQPYKQPVLPGPPTSPRAAFPDSQCVQMISPRAFKLQYEPGKIVEVAAGVQAIPVELKDHEYLIANGVKPYKG